MQALMRGTRPSTDLAKEAEESSGQSANQMKVNNNQVEAAQHVIVSTEPRPESIALPDSDIASTIDARSFIEEPIAKSKADTTSESEASGKSLRINRLSTNLPESASRVVIA